MTDKEKALTAVLLVTILVAAIVILTFVYTIRNVGRIRGIGVGIYWDNNCTLKVETIDWGDLDPGDLAGVTIYIKNIRNTNFTLNLTVGNWTPTIAKNYLVVDWNYSGEVLMPSQVIPVQFTLYVDPSVIGIENFSFDIAVNATGPVET